MKDWMSARMAFNNRRISPIPDVAATLAEMYVPVFVSVMEGRSIKPVAPRSDYYLIDAFNQAYGGKLAGLPSWALWKKKLQALEPLATPTFAGELDLHRHEQQVQEAWDAYAALKAEALAAGLRQD
jgi:hypothetical protein